MIIIINYLITGRPQSMPTTTSNNQIIARNTIENYQHHSMNPMNNSINNPMDNPMNNDHLNNQQDWPGPKPSESAGSTMDNTTNNIIHDNYTNNFNINSGNSDRLPHPAPPPGFADDNNPQFYLTEETEMASNSTSSAKGENFE